MLTESILNEGDIQNITKTLSIYFLQLLSLGISNEMESCCQRLYDRLKTPPHESGVIQIWIRVWSWFIPVRDQRG
ncbi:hypothetical protein RB195_000633 [Necator americanus]|uniref:Uncharacterized protein n=1 Tax=Necator americanus TaxID=51031 RepID=A0ABR1DAM9_NECAM